MKTALVMMFLVVSFPSYGEEPKIYTEQDLAKYKRQSTYDEETILRQDADLKRWEMEKQSEEMLIRHERAKEVKNVGQERDSSKGQPEVSQERTSESNTPAVKKKKKT